MAIKGGRKARARKGGRKVRAAKRPAKRPPKKNGRPTKYRPEFIEQATQLTLLGATDPEIAAFFKVSVATLSTWKITIPGFLEALKLGKDSPDNRVEASLYRRAMGYTHDAVKVLTIGGKVVKVPYTEHYPPDSTACIFWLKNRRASTWRDVRGAELSTVPGKPVEMTYVPAGPELLADYYARLEQAAAAAGTALEAPGDLGSDRRSGAGPEGDPDPVPPGPILSPR